MARWAHLKTDLWQTINSIQLNSTQLSSAQLSSVQFSSIQFNSIPFMAMILKRRGLNAEKVGLKFDSFPRETEPNIGI